MVLGVSVAGGYLALAVPGRLKHPPAHSMTEAHAISCVSGIRIDDKHRQTLEQAVWLVARATCSCC